MSPEPEIVSNMNYSGQRVRIDNKHFINCTFQNCQFEWQGDPAQDTNCKFEGSKFTLSGEALRFHVTLQRFGLNLNAPIQENEGSIQNVPKE